MRTPAPFRSKKDTLRFPLDAPLPYTSIAALARHKLATKIPDPTPVPKKPIPKKLAAKPAAKKRSVPYDVATAGRVRELLSARGGISETLLMGNLAFLLNGTLCCTVGADGMLIRVLAEHREALLAKPGVTPMTMGSRTMKGFVRIAPTAYRTRQSLAGWLARGCQAARAASR